MQLSPEEQTSLSDLAEIAELFESHGIRWSLQGGSVLGPFRDGRFLPGETDIDIAVIAEDWTKELHLAGQEMGFAPYIFHQGKNDNGIHINWQRPGHPWTIEIYPTYQAEFLGKRLRYNGGDRYWRYYFLPEMVEKTRLMDCMGIQVRVPEDTETYLKWMYGENYVTPLSDEQWNWVKDTGARSWNFLQRLEVSLPNAVNSSTHIKDMCSGNFRTFHCQHPQWEGPLYLHDDGKLVRPGADQGTYEISEKQSLSLHWDMWPPETLSWNEDNKLFQSADGTFTAREMIS